LQLVQSFGLRHGHDFKFLTYYSGGNEPIIQMRECPLCTPHKNRADNLWTLGIWMNCGTWNCFRCGNSGNWTALHRMFNVGVGHGDALEYAYHDFYTNHDHDERSGEDCGSYITQISRTDVIPEQSIAALQNKLLNEKPLLHRLCMERNLSARCFEDYKCGLKYSSIGAYKHIQQCLTFPMYQCRNEQFVASKMKLRSVSNGNKSFTQYPMSNEPGWFGFGDASKTHKTCILTEGEFDAMAIYDAMEFKIKPLSVPNGVNSGIPNSMIQQLLHYYNRFVLFYDWDEVGQKGAQGTKQQLEQHRKDVKVQIVEKERQKEFEEHPTVKDANDIIIKYNDRKTRRGHDKLRDMMEEYL